ncbi:carbohydrate kinase FGGY [Calothrix sp. NIES-4071]|nr:carbohydrate kinase FGGY [Calothrix sp. NIES-4071]BAZ58948.1 carbohydrate kinase FGGY [Calothrix sp. NIES-4105]
MALYLGIDFGTSGARCAVIDSEQKIIATSRYEFDMATTDNLPWVWQTSLFTLFDQIPLSLLKQVEAIAINGTSSTVMLCNEVGQPVGTPLLYNDARGAIMLDNPDNNLRLVAPENHTVLSATSSLVKLLWMLQLPTASEARYFLHQADWLAFLLHGRIGISDYHNALKLGYDVENLKYPEWLNKLNLAVELPQVLTPGSIMAPVKSEILVRYGFPSSCVVCAGTTDSIAAFIASGALLPGEGVTSLGSTLAIKLLSRTKIDNSQYGIYSHRFPNFNQSTQSPLWLVGGASNTGGAVLRQFFSSAELEALSSKINFSQNSNLDYYPLIKKGERFPINDANLQPRLEPRPDDDVEFLHGLLESIARIEARGYELLQEFGADKLNRVYTAGGGAANEAWTQIRRRHLNVAVQASAYTEAAYGTALLALLGKSTLGSL